MVTFEIPILPSIPITEQLFFTWNNFESKSKKNEANLNLKIYKINKFIS